MAQHGVEINALEAIRKVVSEINLQELKGVLTYCLPNPIAFRQRQTVMSYDFIAGGMNRIWPGKPDGSLTEQMAYAVWTNLIKDNVDYLIDFHTGRRSAPVWVFYEAFGVSPSVSKEVADKAAHMAQVFGADLLYIETEAYGEGKTLRGVAFDHGIPSIVVEIGGESHFNREQIAIAYRGLINTMTDLGMIANQIKLPKKQTIIKWIADRDKITARAPNGGIFIPTVKIGDRVSKGESLGYIYSPRTFKKTADVTSPQNGLVFQIIENPVVVAGQPVISVPEIIEDFFNH
ncbi:MAG: succinylglutamate desuccinylase/aspartoacylase family protein [Candidatus Bathyarchaeota archaeon]|nr:MAG: succinylglutamate desuccinylase/aspartoacylase family protein [Candidatus Bathyarchaeota archaeon]